MATLSEVLGQAMRRVGVGAQTLSKLTGVPRTAIDNWRDGVVRRPRDWRPLLRIARVLSLSHEEADELLVAAGHQPIGTLARELPGDHPDRDQLHPWLARLQAPRHRLRAPAADFVGRRDALDTLLAALRTGTAAAVRGMGGIGKTELAVLAASELRDVFPDAHLMLSLHGASATPLPASQALRQVIHTFTPDVVLPDDLEALQQRYCAVLSGRRVLILADDAADAAQVRPLRPPPGCGLLVTSRHRFALPGMTTVDLALLAEAEAVALLTGVCDRISPDQAAELARACGYLPLALRISAGVLLNDPALDVADHLAALADRRHRLAQLRDPDDAHLDVAVSLAQSYLGLDPATRSLLRQLGVFAADFDTGLALAVVRVRGTDVVAALHRLLRRNLVEYDPEGDRWRLHDLVQDLALGYLVEAGERSATLWRYAEGVVRIAKETQDQYLAGGPEAERALARFDRDRPHLDAARQWAAAHPGTKRGDRLLVAEAEASAYPGFLRYADRDQLAPQAHRALAAAQRLGDRRGEAVVHNRLGHLYLDLGDLKQAVHHHEQQLDLIRSDGDPTSELRALNNLAIAYTQSARFRQAIELNERQLGLSRHRGNRLHEAMARCNLGRSRLALGDLDVALADLEAALALAQEIGEPYGESIVRSNLGDAHLAADDPATAMTHYQAALEITRAIGDRHLEMQLLADLPPAEAALGRHREALDHATRALAMAKEFGAPQFEAKALRALGLTHAARGDLPRAQAALEEALAILHTIDDPHAVADCNEHLGRLLLTHDTERAMALLRAAEDHRQLIGHARAGDRAAALDGPPRARH
jgi:tetratricopeptide (TPR) repeat protein